MEFSHTFVVPTHNQAKFLPATLDSLLAQEDPRSEIVISEDFSSDESMEIAQGYAARHPDKIRVTRPPEHKGMFPNWNWGIGLARTQWISIMGSDDLALPNFTRTIRDGTIKSPNAIVVCADWDFIDGDGKFLSSEKVLSLPDVLHPPETFYQLVPANKIHPAAHAFRLDVWKKVGGFPENVNFYGDWAFWLTVSPLGDIVHMRRTIARYRVNYRPGVVATRMHQQCADEVSMQMQLMPSIAAQIPDVRQSRISAAGKKRLRGMLHDLVKDCPPDQRPGIGAIVEPWARSLGPRSVRLVERFSAGENIDLGWFETYVRQPARRVYKAMR